MRYISWSKLTRGTAREAAAYLVGEPVTVEVDGEILMVLRASEIVQETKTGGLAASTETTAASTEATEAAKQIVQESRVEASEKPIESAIASNQVVQESDLSKIPGVTRRIPRGWKPPVVAEAVRSRNWVPGLPEEAVTQERPPEPEIIQAVRYVRGAHYAPGTRVSKWNPRTKQTEILIAPEVDAEGNQVWE